MALIMDDATADSGETSAGRPGRLLIVDDEPQICRSLRRILRPDGYEIFTACSAGEALEILAGQPIDVIVSDQQMPHTKGTAFLNEVMTRYPGTVRMILSGAADLADITEAMTAGAIYKFLTKPMDPGLLRANVAEGFARVETLTAERWARDRHDPDTHLQTREQVENAYGQLARSRSASTAAACVMLIQVDQHANIVASFGYAFGEEFMREVARVLRFDDEPNCHICRDAPSSFLLLTADVLPERRLVRLKERLDDVLSAPVLVSGRRFPVTLSVGGTSAADPAVRLRDLVDQANTAMMTASLRGGATMQIYQTDLVGAWRNRVQLESDLRQAVSQQAFELYYQPQVDVATGRIVGLEALLRWRHPEHGFVNPAEFVPVAERLGLINELGLWVFESALVRFAEWDARGIAPPELAVNVSVLQLKSASLVGKLERLLGENRIEPCRLVIEITETAAIEQEEAISECLDGLRSLGITLAMDDFGTGYANLSRLSKLEIKKLKLDRSLLPVGNESRSEKLFANVVTMARELRLELVAEGVETPAELSAVFRAGCPVVQGYFYSPPVDAARLDVILLNQFADPAGRQAFLG